MEINGRVIITGATGAMGAAATEALAAQGADVVLACRNRARAESLRSAILARYPAASLEIRDLDLSSLASVRRFAESVGPADALFNNAGTISRSFSQTPDGLESTFAVNYFGPWLLTTLLADKLPDGAAVVNMVSLSCRFVPFPPETIQPTPEHFSQLGTYASSKRALLSFSQELARRCPRLRVNVADPGVVATGIIDLGRWFDPLTDALFKPFCKTPEKGVQPALNALSSPERLRYFVGKGSRPIPQRYIDPTRDRALWSATGILLGVRGR